MLINFKMPTIVGILTFMGMINFMLSWVEHKKSFYYLGARCFCEEADFSLTPNLDYFTPTLWFWLQLFHKSHLKSMIKLQTFLLECNFTPIFKILVRTLEEVHIFSGITGNNFQIVLCFPSPTIVDILIFINLIQKSSESLKARNVFIFHHFRL